MSASHNQFSLLKTKRFLPLFLTQFLGAFNDNIFKNSLVLLITYKITIESGMSPHMLVTLAGAVFISPFFLFSGVAGFLADKYDKSVLIHKIKLAEILIMILAAVGFYFKDLTLLFVVLFLMGSQSAFFGPIKYSILPEALESEELVGGNAIIEFGTFLAILFGSLLGLIITYPNGEFIASIIVVFIAIIGWLCSLSIPKTEVISTKKLDFNIFSTTYNIIKETTRVKSIYLAVIGISWFWFIGSLLLSQVPNLVKDVLKADEWIINIFIATFSVGIGVGSLLCNKILKSTVHTTYLPLSSLIMTLSILLLSWVTSNNYFLITDITTIPEFFSDPYGWIFIIALFLISSSAGFFVVPLYAFLQVNSDKDKCSQVIAGTNIISSIFVIASSVFAFVLISFNFSIAQIFLSTAILNAFVTYLIFQLLPEDVLRSILRYFFKLFFKVEVEGEENFIKAGGHAVIIANHASLLDAALLVSMTNQKITFAIDTAMSQKWWLKPFLKVIDTLPIDPHNPLAIKKLIKYVKQGKRIMIFPEGRITVTGSLMKIYEGPGLIATKTNANILPVCIEGAQYSYFSYLRGKVRIRLFPKIKLTFFEPRKIKAPEELIGRKKRQYASEKIYRIMTNMLFSSHDKSKTLFELLIDASKLHGKRKIVLDDTNKTSFTYQNLIRKSFIVGELIKRHAKKEKNIGVLLPNISSTALLFFSIQALSKIAVMLNFSSGFTNLMYACDTVKLKIVYTSRAFIKAVSLEEVIFEMRKKGIKVIYLEDLKENLRRKEKFLGLLKSFYRSQFFYKYDSQKPCVILFTSGSENIPKAVVLSHKNIQANLQQTSIVVDYTSKDTIFNALPLFHSFGLTMGLISPLLSGLKVFLYPSPLHYRIIPQICYDINATILFGTDTFLNGYARVAHAYDFYSIRYVFSGAEKLQRKTRQMWVDNFGIRILEGYGATEASPVISINTPMYNKAGSVGRLLPGVNFHLEKVEGIEEGGKLHISGPNLMLGYIKHDKPGVLSFPELHAKASTPLKQLKWYDTGDIVKIDKSGYLYIIGRLKRFAKIGGEMVSLVAIETYCNRLSPDHHHATVIVTDEIKGEKIILATTDPNLKKPHLLEYLKKQKISTLYLPSQILYFDSLPLLGAGKIDHSETKKICEEKIKGKA